MRLELITAYAVSIARVASWALASSLVYRTSGLEPVAVMMLARGTMGLLSYGSLGLGPALISVLSRTVEPVPVINVYEQSVRPTLSYQHPNLDSQKTLSLEERYICTAMSGIVAISLVLFAVLFVYAAEFETVHHLKNREYYWGMVELMGAGFLLRLISDVPSAVMQRRGMITVDNVLQLVAECSFIVGMGLMYAQCTSTKVSGAFFISSLILLLARMSYARIPVSAHKFEKALFGVLVAAGAWVVLGQLADWFYAPVNNFLIAWFDDAVNVGFYSPAVQLDGALLLLVGGLSAVLFPKSAIAFSSGKIDTIRNYFIKGTLASLLLLTCGAVVISLYGKWIMTKWFGTSFPITEAILPLVMIHTVIGGASSVGRSILMGIGKLKVYAISSIIGGLCNAILAAIAVGVFHWGLKGIIFVTIFTVTIRCAIWMPWYVLHTLKHEQGKLNIGSINDQGTAGSV